ncbi:hypothetical protein ACHAWX_004094 [Stephanocyclus meneghinianus]
MNYLCENNNESITSRVYGCIRDGEFTKAIEIFDSKEDIPRSRPALSLLAYCCYSNQDYARAAEFYEELVSICPEVEEYRVNYAQALVMSGAYHDACRVETAAMSGSSSLSAHSQRLRLLHAQSQLELGMLTACNKTLSKCIEDDPETVIAMATRDYKEGKFASAIEKYKIARQIMGDVPMLMYYIALCSYRMGDHETAFEKLNEMTSLAVNEEGTNLLEDSVLRDSFAVEALNLKAVICYETNQVEAAREAIAEMHELTGAKNLDSISIHNHVICSIDVDHVNGIERLSHLLSSKSFPPETLANILILFIKYGDDVLAEQIFEANSLLAKELLSPGLLAYLDAAILSLSRPDDACCVLENLVAELTPELKKATKRLNDAEATSTRASTARLSTTSIRPTTTARTLTASLADAKEKLQSLLDIFIPILMLQAKLFWDRKEYTKAENLLLQHADYCKDNNEWNLNMGHILFTQQNDKFERSISYYESVVNKYAQSEQLLKAPPVALANLCVSYIMTGQNDAAEGIIKAVEKEEEEQQQQDNMKPTYHTCLVNLVIGTLYCERGNYEFGISRICKSLDPLEKNLCPDSWFYAKTCFLALAGNISKLMFVMDHDMFCNVIDFLTDVERHGNITAGEGDIRVGFGQTQEPVTVSLEARQLRHLFLKLVA